MVNEGILEVLAFNFRRDGRVKHHVSLQNINRDLAAYETQNNMAMQADGIGQTYGRSNFGRGRSSNGKGTKTTLPLIMEWPPISKGVNVLFRCF
jgi:hypothetical protein